MPKAPRSIPLKWSPALCLATIFVFSVPLLACLPAEVPRSLVVLVCLASLISAAYAFRAGWRVHAACLRPDDDGVLLVRGEHSWRGRVLATSQDLGWLVVLHWQPEGGGRVRRFCLLRDGFTADSWRLLKVWVRWALRES